MIVVAKEFRFEAAHKLPYHDGKCRGLHGHSYRFTLEVRGDLVLSGPKYGMVIDYKDIGSVAKEILEKLDHRYLNDVLGFEDTTAERISIWIFDFVKSKIPQLWAVSVKETENSSARYAPIESRVMKIGTQLENENDKDLKGRRPKGEKHSKALLRDAEVVALWRDFLKRGKEKGFVHRWEKRLKVEGRGLVTNIIRGWSWNHITGLSEPKQ